jgi:hypothetical protein
MGARVTLRGSMPPRDGEQHACARPLRVRRPFLVLLCPGPPTTNCSSRRSSRPWHDAPACVDGAVGAQTAELRGRVSWQ